MAFKFTNGVDLVKTALINAVLHPVTVDVSAPVDGQIWYRSDTDRFRVRANGVTQDLAFMADVTGGAITGSLWDAQSYIKAIVDDTPVVQVVGSGEFVGRAAGGDLGVMTPAQARTSLNVADGAQVNDTAAQILTKLLTVDGTGSGLDADTVDGVHAAALATITYVDTEITDAIAALVDTAPGTLDTLNEIAAALGDDPNFATTITASIAAKATKYAGTIGDGSTTAIAVTHSLGTRDITWSVQDATTFEFVMCDVVATSTSVATFTFATAPASNAYRVTIIG